MKPERTTNSSDVAREGRTPSDYRLLSTMRLLKDFEETFRSATGIPVRLVPAGASAFPVSSQAQQNAFCALMSKHPKVRSACWKSHEEAREAGAKRSCCWAGLQILAVPVVVKGDHIATWIGGQVFRTKPTRAHFSRVAEALARSGVVEGWPRIESAFLGGRIVDEEQFQAGAQLLKLFAQHLGQKMERLHNPPQPAGARSWGRKRSQGTPPALAGEGR